MSHMPKWLRPASLILSAFIVLAAMHPVLERAAQIVA